MYSLVRDSDILVDASFSEGFGLLPLEAMCTGTIPIVSDSLGNREYCVDEENSIIIKQVNDSDLYVEKIKEILNDKNKMNHLKENAIKTANNYNFEKTIFDYKDTLCKILSGEKKPIKRSLKKKEKTKLEKYLYSDKKFNKMIEGCKNNYSNNRKSYRLSNFKTIAREFVKANVYLSKHAVKTIIDKNHRV